MIKKLKPIINKLCIVTVATICLSLGAVVIAGSTIKNDDMKYSVNLVDTEGNLLDTIPIGIGIRGDANSDGKVTVRDAAQVANYLANSAANPNYMPGFADALGGAMADANADGKLNVRDAANIAKYLANISANPDAGWE